MADQNRTPTPIDAAGMALAEIAAALGEIEGTVDLMSSISNDALDPSDARQAAWSFAFEISMRSAIGRVREALKAIPVAAEVSTLGGELLNVESLAYGVGSVFSALVDSLKWAHHVEADPEKRRRLAAIVPMIDSAEERTVNGLLEAVGDALGAVDAASRVAA